jgi:hypothetical protein
MVGYGSGVTAGASLQWPLAHLDVAEIEAAMIDASRFFDHVNHKPLDDPRARLHIADGRNFLEFATLQYDIIVSEPSNPWIAGVANLFTVEHFTRARRHLKPRGVFSQWVQLYELHPDNVRTILASFRAAFPHVLAFSSMPKGTDLILIGSEHPLPLSIEGISRAWQIPSARAEFERAGLHSPHDLYGLLFMNQQELDEFSRGAALNTDDNGTLEFRTPRDIISYQDSQRFFTDKYHAQASYGDIRPHLIDWPARQTHHTALLATSNWLAGKRLFAASLLHDDDLLHADLIAKQGTPQPLIDLLHVLRACDADRRDLTLRFWPIQRSELSVMIDDTLRHSKETQAMQIIEAQSPPPKHGYDGERGLFYAHLLTERGYYKLAKVQLNNLRQDPIISASLPFLLLDGFVHIKRLDYRQAFESYLNAGRLLTRIEQQTN